MQGGGCKIESFKGVISLHVTHGPEIKLRYLSIKNLESIENHLPSGLLHSNLTPFSSSIFLQETFVVGDLNHPGWQSLSHKAPLQMSPFDPSEGSMVVHCSHRSAEATEDVAEKNISYVTSEALT